jgi:thiol-disulfide isomerase/thioredoxin
LNLAEKNRKDPSVVAVKYGEGKERRIRATWLALMMFTSNADPAKAEAGFDKAIKIIFEDYAQDMSIVGVLQNPDLVRAAERMPDYDNRLRAIAEKHPTRDGQGAACLALALHLKQQVTERVGKDHVELTQEAIKWLERVAEKYANVKHLNGMDAVTLGQVAKEELATIRKWVAMIGKAAPEIEGEDINGKAMKLSDQRGKVVVLSFWFSDCAPCRKMIPDEKALVKRLDGKPFVLLGVNNDLDRNRAKKLAQKEQMTWRSWWDGGTGGPIADRWSVEGWPTVFVIDHQGVVRYKGALIVNNGKEGMTLEEAVESLLKEIKAKK